MANILPRLQYLKLKRNAPQYIISVFPSEYALIGLKPGWCIRHQSGSGPVMARYYVTYFPNLLTFP